MKLTVYTVSGAPRGWRVLLGLAFKGLKYETKFLKASEGEHKSAEFRAINPRGTVPVLDADGLIMRDSLGILAWLDRQYPEPPLFGETPEEVAVVWQATLECCDYLRDAANTMLAPILLKGESLPDEGTKRRADYEAAAEALHTEYGFLEGLLDRQPYLAGHSPSAVDAVAFPEIAIVQRAVETKRDIMDAFGFTEIASKYPLVTAWKERIAALPSVVETMPPHWSE